MSAQLGGAMDERWGRTARRWQWFGAGPHPIHALDRLDRALRAAPARASAPAQAFGRGQMLPRINRMTGLS
eukprot:2126533-Heterocapsa_arctica.AAC.1